MEKLYVLDASGYLYRSYFAIRQMTNAKGESTNALFGFIRSVMRLRKDFNPKHIVAVFDGPHNAKKRLEIYPQYKAHRSEMPGDLLYQIKWAQQFCTLAGIPELMVPEVEADDTMGSIAKWASEQQNTEVYLCTGDKDLCQLVNDKVFVLNTYKENLVLGSAQVEAQFGVTPSQIIDYLAIVGDASDNVPGVSGFGPKTTSDLLKQFGSLDYLLEHPLEIPGKKKQETLIEQREKAIISRNLVTIETNVAIPQTTDFYKWQPPQIQQLKEFYGGMNFNSFIRELEQIFLGDLVKEEAASDVFYELIDDEDSLNRLIKELQKKKEVCFDTETTHQLPFKAELVGVGLGVSPKQAWYVPVNGKLGLDNVLAVLKPFFENNTIGFYGHNVKYDLQILANYGVNVAKISFDTILASYLLNSHSRQHSLDNLALEYFDKIKIATHELLGKGKKQITMRDVPIEKVSYYCCEDVDYTIRLKELLEREVCERGLEPLFKNLEVPLLRVLFKMERHGIFVDTECLKILGKEVESSIRTLEQDIYSHAGEIFNLNSPKQLSYILFDKMGIKPPRKTATGHSTDADVLESLKGNYPFVSKILDYRMLEKLRSTYIETLPLEVNPKTERIHCTFNQTVAATGRLSCQDPNLQNIPVRSELGRELRAAFRPQKAGWYFLAADYSQIELRLLAHMSEDSALIEAFNRNADIHAITAASILNIPLSEVTKEQRHQAKAVNFGVIYGQQAFGLARELNIDIKVAATFIEMYFQKYKRIKEYIESCKEAARKTGKATTLIGRERLIPDINSKNPQIRAAAERLAINTPLQGTAADLIKMAMLQIDGELKLAKKRAFMVLQIHDELIFEVPNEEVIEMECLVRESMQSVLKLKVPLLVDITVGKNWKEC